MSDAALRAAYSVWALGYDAVFGSATSRARRRSIELLAPHAGERVLLVGVGTGLDLTYLPRHSTYQAVDLTPAMLRRAGKFKNSPPSPAEYRKLATRVVDLHPLTIAQNARTSGGGNISLVPTQAISVGPVETWQAEKVSIWQAGNHDNPFGQRLTCLMIAKKLPDAAVPMSLLADHPNVQFNYFRGGLGTCTVEMH